MSNAPSDTTPQPIRLVEISTLLYDLNDQLNSIAAYKMTPSDAAPLAAMAGDGVTLYVSYDCVDVNDTSEHLWMIVRAFRVVKGKGRTPERVWTLTNSEQPSPTSRRPICPRCVTACNNTCDFQNVEVVAVPSSELAGLIIGWFDKNLTGEWHR